MEPIQCSGRFSYSFCGRRLNGFGKNSHEGRSSYRPHLSPSFLAGRHSFSHLLHGCIVTRPLQFLAERLLRSTLRRGLLPAIRHRSCGSPGSSGPSRLRSMAARRPVRACLKGTKLMHLYRSRLRYYTVYIPDSSPCARGIIMRFSLFPAYLRICRDVWAGSR